VLSLHHLEGRIYTYKDTQLLRYNDLNRSSPVLKKHRFERTDRTHRLHLTAFGVGMLARFAKFCANMS
jgi:hypothetical protein